MASTSRSTSSGDGGRAGAVHAAASTGYSGSHAANYHSIRPGYPDEVADFVLQHTLLAAAHDSTAPTRQQQQRILDVGCGTGKWTATLDAALRRHGIQHSQLEGVDPVQSMADALAQQLPHVSVHTAAATNLPFGEGQFDLLTAATAFHWFCDDDSVRGLHRVLKPRGCFAVVGYDLSVRDSWTAPMQRLMDSHYPASVPYPRHGDWRRALDRAEQQRMFEPVAHRVFSGAAVMRTDRAGMVNRFLSASRIAALPEDEKAHVIEQFNKIIDADDKLRGDSEFVMQDDVEVTIVRKVHYR